jgi:hypothetical protein
LRGLFRFTAALAARGRAMGNTVKFETKIREINLTAPLSVSRSKVAGKR